MMAKKTNIQDNIKQKITGILNQTACSPNSGIFEPRSITFPEQNQETIIRLFNDLNTLLELFYQEKSWLSGQTSSIFKEKNFTKIIQALKERSEQKKTGASYHVLTFLTEIPGFSEIQKINNKLTKTAIPNESIKTGNPLVKPSS